MANALTKIGGYGSTNGAEISAFDPGSDRLFVVAGDVVEVLNLTNPSSPTKITDLALDTSTLPTGFNLVPNSVAVGKADTVSAGIVAVALAVKDDLNNQEIGQVQFFNAADGSYIRTVNVGYLPDMVTFTPDGTKVLTANEGEPNESYTSDPEGSVSIIDISGGVAAATVQSATFTTFNTEQATLEAAGVRIFGQIFDSAGAVVRDSTVAEDVEPEYITFNGDGTKAWVTLQENNAIAIVDIASATVESILPLGLKDHNSVTMTDLETFEFTNLPSIGSTDAGQELFLGGFSGLFYEGTAANGNLKFVTNTDRGPNGEATGINRPFLLPDFTPEIVRFELNPFTETIAITQRIQLKDSAGELLTGLPNTAISTNGNQAYNDEVPVDLNNNPITPLDPLGGDFEGIVINPTDNTFWMVDEYRPAIYHFGTDGTLIDRFVPTGTAGAAGQAVGTFGEEALPAVLAQRRQNRGFEAVALNTDNGKLYAFVQSPLRNPDTLTNSNLNSLNNIRIVEFDVATEAVTAQYLYRMDNGNLGADPNTRPDKLGDAVYIGNGEFLVVERDDDSLNSGDALNTIEKKIYRFSLAGATNINGQDAAIDLGGGTLKTIDQMTEAELVSQGINLIDKVLHVDLATAGYNTVEKVEGLALVDANTIAVLNDNDFQVAGITINTTTGTFTPDPTPEPVVLGLITTNSNGLDASDRDVNFPNSGSSGRINIQNWPVFGLYQPDSIASFTANGQTYYVTANEGDTRVRPTDDNLLTDTSIDEGDIFTEESRLSGVDLDNTLFPDEATLKLNQNLGRLTVTTATGDTDNDGDIDQIHVPGARSFSIWDSTGTLVYDSGNDFEEIIAEQFPTFFNASNDNNTLDNRSDNKGPEPEGITVGKIGARTYAFIGLERIGGVMVYDVTLPETPTFVEYLNDRDFTANPETNDTDSGPEGLLFIPSSDSPNGENLVVVANEISQTVSVLEFTPPAFTLQLLHYYGESGLLGIETAPIMGALIDKFDGEYTNTLVIGEGDSYIPGPWLIGGADPSLNSVPGIGTTALGRPDIAIMNAFGTDASALGNHEFDLGSPVLQAAITASGSGASAWVGAQFPLITANLNFAADSSLRGLADATLGGTATNAFAGQEASNIKGKIAPYTVVTQNGEKIGIVGATTYDLLIKTSPNGTVPKDDGNLSTDDLQEVAAYIQAAVDSLTALGVNKIVMVDQLDTIDRNKLLAPLVSGIDVMIAGGGHERMGDATDTAVGFNGHTADFIEDAYPIVTAGLDGKTTLIVTTDTEYTYLGRLVVDFDANGEIIVENLDTAINGAYAATEATLQAAYGTTQTAEQIIASSTIGTQVDAITDAINVVISTKDGTLWGYTNVYLEGDRAFGRTQEVNLGDINADANIYAAQQALGSNGFIASLKNGGGIRASIGSIAEDGTKIAPIANPIANKPAGAISTLDIENALRFDNKLMVFDTTPQGLKNILEFAAGLSSSPSQQSGGYMQIGGVRVSYDPDNATGSKVESIALTDLEGNVTAVVYGNGVLASNAPASISMVSINFTVNGGDGYPIKANGENFRYLLTDGTLSAAIDESLDFTAAANVPANALGEQKAFQEYLQEFHATPATAFDGADTTAALDQRIQNLNFREDTVTEGFDAIVSITTLDANEVEGDSGTTAFTFSVTRSGDVTSTVTVNYTVDGAELNELPDGDISATTDDFGASTSLTGTLTFGANETSKVLTVDVAGDTIPEVERDFPSRDAFVVSLSSPSSGAALSQTATSATGYIINDDTPAQPFIVAGTPGDDNLVPILDGFSGFNSLVFTGAGSDEVDIPAGGDNLLGSNRIFTGSSSDTIFVADSDRAFGGSGDDELDATEATGYRISGGAGNDEFFLGVGGRALGGDGDDTFTIFEGGGNLLSGGAGSDRFNILTDSVAVLTTPNTIVDFTIGTDTLGILNQGAEFDFNDLTLTGNEIKVGGNTIAILVGVQTNTLTANSFSFS